MQALNSSGAQTDGAAQIVLQSTELPVNAAPGCMQEVCLYLPKHIQYLRGRFFYQPVIALVKLVGQQIVFHHVIAMNAQQFEQQRGGHAGTVFAGGAVKHQGIVVGADARQKSTKHRALLPHERTAGVAHDVHGLDATGLLAPDPQLAQAHQYRGLNGQMLLLGTRQVLGSDLALQVSAQIHAARHTQRKQALVIRGAESRQVVAAIDLCPQNVWPVRCCQAPQVAKI